MESIACCRVSGKAWIGACHWWAEYTASGKCHIYHDEPSDVESNRMLLTQMLYYSKTPWCPLTCLRKHSRISPSMSCAELPSRASSYTDYEHSFEHIPSDHCRECKKYGALTRMVIQKRENPNTHLEQVNLYVVYAETDSTCEHSLLT